MRTLKKVLALSLVFAMAFTLMAGAAYKDEDSIDSSLRDDITLLEALGVFQGDENGNFNPTNNVTRAEAAKMIYVLKNNGVDDGAVAFQGVATFSDVPVGHWAEGYVNYCANLGIMAGWTENGQKVFNPNGNVTGVEMTKMLLCLIGYRADIQGYTNNNSWQTNVLMDGANSGITNNYTPSVYSAAPRQWTARLMVNAINAPFVTYNRGEITYGTVLDPTASYGLNYLQLGIAEGTLTASNTVRVAKGAWVDKDDDGDADTFEQANLATALRGTNQDEITVDVERVNNEVTSGQYSGPTNYEINIGNELLGQKVKVYYRVNSQTDLTPRNVFAVLADSSEKVVNTTVDQITTSSTNVHNLTVEGEGTMTYGSAHPVDLYVDYVRVDSSNTFNDCSSTTKNIYEENLGINSSASAKVIYDKDGYVSAIYVSSKPVYAVVDEIDAENGVLRLSDAQSARVVLKDVEDKTINFTRADSENFADYLNVDSSVAAEDVVKITKNLSTGELKYDVTVLEPINASVSNYTTKDSSYDTMTIDGTAYELDANAMNSYTWLTGNTAVDHNAFYVDGSYVVYSTGESTANINNLAYVYGTGASQDSFGSVTFRVKVLLADGTKGTYVLNKNTGVGEKADIAGTNDQKAAELKKLANEQVFTYSLRDNTITLKDITPEKIVAVDNQAKYFTANSPITYDESKQLVTIDSADYAINDSTYFFVKDTTPGVKEADMYAVVKASELSEDVISTKGNGLLNNLPTSTFVAQRINGFNTVLAGVLNLDDMPGAVVADYYFVNGTANVNRSANADGQYEITLPVVTADGESTLVFKYDDSSDLYVAAEAINGLDGMLVEADLAADGSVDTTGGETEGLTKIDITNPEWSTDWHIGALRSLSVADGQATIITNVDDNTSNIVKLADDAKLFVIDDNGSNPADFETEGSYVTAEEIVNADGVGTGKYYTNAIYLTNSDGEIVAIFTETSGQNLGKILEGAVDANVEQIIKDFGASLNQDAE